jgi:hypothetical protein
MIIMQTCTLMYLGCVVNQKIAATTRLSRFGSRIIRPCRRLCLYDTDTTSSVVDFLTRSIVDIPSQSYLTRFRRMNIYYDVV